MADMNDALSAPESIPVPTATIPGTIKVPAFAVPAEPVKLFNREFSWIEFNRRVLGESFDQSVPLLERVKFLSIASSNLDEFLMVRVGAIRELLEAGLQDRSPDGLTPKQQMKGIRERVKSLLVDMYRALETILLECRNANISIESFSELSKKEQAALTEHYDKYIAPILTPLAVDPGHPFPFLASRALTIAALLETERGESHIALMKVPPLLARLIPVPDGGSRFVPIESLIEQNLGRFFPGLAVRKVVPFRVLRNTDTILQEDEVQDLLKSVESELRRRERKEVVWVEVAASADDTIVNLLSTALRVTADDIFFTPGLPKLSDLMELYRNVGKASLKEPGFNPRIPPQLASSEDIFAIIREGDVLLHRPFESFLPVVEFVQTAADDPEVLAIKQTLYRTDTGSAIVEALVKAAQSGKQVTAIVELQARFDEMKNIAWAKRLEEAGVQVVYGLVGIKTHSKICLVIRREGAELRRYVHISTGNYNAGTARIYTDLDLLTVEPGFGDDASQFMNLLTGYSIATIQDIFDKQSTGWSWQRFTVAPIDYHDWALRMIDREARNAKEGKPAQIIAKLNALVDPTVIEALYKASQAGVRIDLIVRGICALVPGVAGLSDNIKVTSIVDRFLEHTRILLFRNGGATEIYVASGDWMPRNFFRRVELCFPILSEKIRQRIEEQILAACLADNVKAWRLQTDGTYKKRANSDPPFRSQEKFIELARSEAVRIGTYEETITKPAAWRKKAKRHRKREKEKTKS